MSKLETLRLSGTRVADISALANKPGLRRLYLDGTRVSDLSPLADARALEFLWISDTLVSDLAPLAELSQLEAIHARSTYVSRVPPLSGMLSLEELSLSSSPVEDVSGLRVSPQGGLARLREINLGFTLVTDIEHLADLPALRSLNVSSTLVPPEEFEAFRARRRDVEAAYGHFPRTEEAVNGLRAVIMGSLKAADDDAGTDVIRNEQRARLPTEEPDAADP